MKLSRGKVDGREKRMKDKTGGEVKGGRLKTKRTERYRKKD